MKRPFLLTPGITTPLGAVTWSGYVRNSLLQKDLPPEPYGTYALTYLLEGDGVYENERGVRQEITGGDMIVTFPDIRRKYGSLPGQSWSEFYIIFNGPIFDLWRSVGLLDDQRPLHRLEPVDYWARRFRQVIGPSYTTVPLAMKRVCALQAALSEMLNYEQEKGIGRKGRAWLEQAYRRLDDMDASDPSNFSPVLSALNLGYAGFRKRFTRLAGISPGQHLAKLQIQRVCHLLETTDLKLRPIARQCGFTDQYHLSKRFKQILGITPREYRLRAMEHSQREA